MTCKLPNSSSSLHPNRREVLGAAAGGLLTAGAASLFPKPAIAATPKLKVGYLSPVTGPFAAFAEADPFLLRQCREALKGGIVNHGKTYEVEIVSIDDQSNPDRASQATQQLINKEAVNIVLAQGALTIANVSAQCELAGVPSIVTMNPWQAWMFPLGSSPDKGFKYSNMFFWGIEDIISTYVGMWSTLQTNRKVGICFSNDPPGQTFSDAKIGFPPALKAAGFELVDIGLYQPGSNDFSRQIAGFRDAGVDIVTGLFAPPEWVVFWRQAQQAGFKPKVATVARALLFPAGIQALGQDANGMSTEIWWTPHYPYKSSITGQSAAQLASAFEADAKKRWTQPIGVIHAMLEAGVYALKNAADPTDPEAVQAAIVKGKVDTIVGTLDWAGSPIKNVAKLAIAGGQWAVDEKGDFELNVTYNKALPQVPIDKPFQMHIGK